MRIASERTIASKRTIARTLAGALALALLPAVVAGGRPAVAAAPAASGGAATDAAKPAAYTVVDLEAIKKLMDKRRGKVVLVHFWASWCYPCMQELPVVDRLARDLKPRGLEVLSVSLDNPRTAGPRVGTLLHRLAPNLTPAIAKFEDADGFISAFDTNWEGAIPAMFAYDQKGGLRGTLIGESTREELEKFVGRLLKPAAAAAPAPASVPTPASALAPAPAPSKP